MLKCQNYLDLASTIKCFMFWKRHTHKTCSSQALYTVLPSVHNDIHFGSFSNTTIIATCVHPKLLKCIFLVLCLRASLIFGFLVSVYFVNARTKAWIQSLNPGKDMKDLLEDVREGLTGKYTYYQGRYIPFLFNLWVASCTHLRFTTARRLTLMEFFVNQSIIR